MGFFWCLFSAIAAFFSGVMISDNHNLVTRRYRLKSDKIHLNGKEKLRMVVLADLHNQNFGEDNQRLLALIERQEPDFILIPGDLITVKNKVKYKEALHFLTVLARRYPVYYGLGNHEIRLLSRKKHYDLAFGAFLKMVEDSGAVLLHDRSAILTDYNISLDGYTLPERFYAKKNAPRLGKAALEKALGNAQDGRYHILIAHNPDYFGAYAAWGADLTVSGHIHGGLMVLPGLGGFISPKMQLFPRYDGGLFHHGGKHMVLSRGLGTHTLPIRIFNPGEVCVIELVGK